MNPNCKSYFNTFSTNSGRVEVEVKITEPEKVIEISSRVKHLSGGPAMIVGHIYQHIVDKDAKTAYCDRYVGPSFQREAFDVRCLKLI